MEALADKGNGAYYYVDNIYEAKKVLVNEFSGLYTIAKDVKLQLEFNPAFVEKYRLIGYENRLLNTEDFADDKKDAGEIGAGHSVTALYEYIPTKKNERAKESGLRYQSVELTEHAKKSDEILSLKIRYKDPKEDISKLLVFNSQNDKKKLNKTSNNFRFATAVAEYCLLLRDSEEKGNANFDQVLELAKGSRGDDPDGLRAELIRLVESAQILSVENEEKKEAEENKEIPE